MARIIRKKLVHGDKFRLRKDAWLTVCVFGTFFNTTPPTQKEREETNVDGNPFYTFHSYPRDTVFTFFGDILNYYPSPAGGVRYILLKDPEGRVASFFSVENMNEFFVKM